MTILIKVLLLVPMFFLGLTAGAFFGNVYQDLRHKRPRRRPLDRSLLQPSAICGAVMAVIAIAVYWQLTGR